jgi:uncharacterized membrane protein
MDALLVFLLIIAIILLINVLNKVGSQSETIKSLDHTLRDLSDQVFRLSIQRKQSSQQEKSETRAEEPTVVAPVHPETTVNKEETPAPVPLNVPGEQPQPVAAVNTETPAPQPVMVEQPVSTPQPSWWDNWVKNNPDLEKFIGENLANKIGIAVLVLGIAFFVKYAIDREWINEVGRVAIGLVAGGLLIALAHRTRNSYRSFSSVLVGGGLTVFYFTIAFAFHQYHLMSQQAAFGIMVLITAFAVGLAVLYDRMELAVLATLGGFITPFLVSTGQDNYVALFTYLAILNTGLMVLSWFKRWPAINFIALFFTIIIYGGWLTNKIWLGDQLFPVQPAIIFATIFYVQFLTMNILNNLRINRKFGAFDFIVVFSVNCLYYAAGIIILNHLNGGEYKGLFTASLGVFNLASAWYFYKKRKMDRNFIFLLIGLTISFISLAAPVQLKGNYITLFWSAESVVLFWLFQRSRIQLIKVFSLLVLGAMFVSLFMDWYQVYFSSNSLPIVINRGFVTNIVATSALFIYYALMKTEGDSYYIGVVTNRSIRRFLWSSGIILLFATGLLETWFQFNKHFAGTDLYVLYIDLYVFAFANVLLLFTKKAINLRILITALCFVVYLVSMETSYEITFNMLQSGVGKAHFWAHWVAALCMAKLIVDLVLFVKNNIEQLRSEETAFSWLISLGSVVFLSMEVFLVILWINAADASDWSYWQNLYAKAGLSITWGICAFIIMWLGMKFNNKTLRIISLTLILVTLAKLFLSDIRNIPVGGKIAAFILLGVLLLIISFMYQRLKKIIIDDKAEEK